MLDLKVPKADVRRFAEAPDPETAVKGLVVKGWWEDRGDCWYVGLRFPEWQRERFQVERRRAYLAEAKRRSRAHHNGDHSLCLADKCPRAPRESTVDALVDSTHDPGRDGSGPTVPPVPQNQERDQGQDHSAANSQDRRVHDGPALDGPDDQQIPPVVHLQSPATDRDAREDTQAWLADPAPDIDPGDDPDPDPDPEAERRRQLDALSAMMRAGPEAAAG